MGRLQKIISRADYESRSKINRWTNEMKKVERAQLYTGTV